MRLAVAVPSSVAFLAIIQMLDQLIIYLGTRVDTDVSFTIICEFILYPIAWLVTSVVVVWPAQPSLASMRGKVGPSRTRTPRNLGLAENTRASW
jgi:hypothetical protein